VCVLDSSVSGWGLVMGYGEHANESSVSVKGREFRDNLSMLLASQEGLHCTELVR
jgi:hypothetical protein